MFLAQVAQTSQEIAQTSQESDWRTWGPVVGGVAGAMALIHAVWRGWFDRRPRLRILARVRQDGETCEAAITVTNVGQTVESVREIGLARVPGPLEPFDDRWAARGRYDETGWALGDIARAVRETREKRGAAGFTSSLIAHRPERRAWPMAPGDLAEVDFDLALYRANEPKPGSAGLTSKPGGPSLPPLRPYALLASGKTVSGPLIHIDLQSLEKARTARHEKRAQGASPFTR